jgi:hypothetical protein
MDAPTSAVAIASVAAATRILESFFSKVVGATGEIIANSLLDRYNGRRAVNLAKVVARAQERARENGLDPSKIPLKVIHPLIENASLEEDVDLQNMWANLLYAASDQTVSPKPYPAFVEVMKQLSREEARLFNAMWDVLEPLYDAFDRATPPERESLGHPLKHFDGSGLGSLYLKANALPEGTERERPYEIGVALENMERLGLLELKAGHFKVPRFSRLFASVCRHGGPREPLTL